jgi:glycine/D-amino acid oxidase-like deaminating enzyme/nitrite reductase/ring-hydroxylating ferredoxin subunit
LTEFAPLRGKLTTDVAVIGAGIAGLTTALELLRARKDVVVIEADRIGHGVTGHSTAKVTALQGLVYARLQNSLGEDAARAYAAANQAGIQKIASLVEELDIECDFERQAAYTFTRDEDFLNDVRREVDAACQAGLPATFTTETDLPFEILGAVRLANQAQMDPYRYCVGLARAVQENGGRIFEKSRATNIEMDGSCTVSTTHGEVLARRVVLATLLPFLDDGGFFARTYPSRSYGIAVELDGSAPDGMYINVESPTRSVRPLPHGRGIVVVGEQHKVGQDADTDKRFAALESWARKWFPVRSVTHRWSAQDYIAADGLPYIGRLSRASDQLLVVTGLNKWGLAIGTAAASMLKDLIQGRTNPWEAVFDAGRVNALASAQSLIKENLDVAKRFVGDRLRSIAAKGLAELHNGEAAIVEHNGERLAAYRDDTGTVHAVSPVCSHMGCLVQWNRAERSWDCPCHGSRFDFDGHVLQGPAVDALEAKRTS